MIGWARKGSVPRREERREKTEERREKRDGSVPEWRDGTEKDRPL